VMVLWCNVGFASANIYLVCPIKITTDNSFFGLKKMHQASNNFINQFYINIKTSSSSIKMNYYAHVSPDGVFDWQNIKPTKSKLKFKGYVEDDHYIFENVLDYKDDILKIEMYTEFDFYKKEGEWFLSYTVDGIYNNKLVGLKSDDLIYDYNAKNNCVEYNKKEFLNIRKKGDILEIFGGPRAIEVAHKTFMCIEISGTSSNQLIYSGTGMIEKDEKNCDLKIELEKHKKLYDKFKIYWDEVRKGSYFALIKHYDVLNFTRDTPFYREYRDKRFDKKHSLN